MSKKPSKKERTASFVLELKLNTSEHDRHVLEHRFYINNLMRNRLIHHARKALATLRQDEGYRGLISEYVKLAKLKDPVSDKKQKEISQKLTDVRLQFGVSEYQFHSWIAVQQRRYKKYIDSATAQKTASDVWKATEKVLFGDGKCIHFRKLMDLDSLESKSNAAGIRFRNGRVYWLGLCMQPKFDKKDIYETEALKHRVKYCRIARKAMGQTFHYYIQLILEGTPPKKHSAIEGRVGIDPGVSTEAVFLEKGCILTDLRGNAENIQNRKARLQRKIDRSRRATNPGHFNENGTIRKCRDKWTYSNTYKKDRMRLKTLQRRNRDTLKQSEEILANRILEEHGSEIYVEKMNYKALQKKAKRSKDKTGKERPRKRFGKSLAKHAPSRFLSILERKLGYVNKRLNYVNTWKYKASQYDHVTDMYKKIPLKQRAKMIGGDCVQRDLYSAFLLFNAADEEHISRKNCFKYFLLFLRHQEQCINELRINKYDNPSFGLQELAA